MGVRGERHSDPTPIFRRFFFQCLDFAPLAPRRFPYLRRFPIIPQPITDSEGNL